MLPSPSTPTRANYVVSRSFFVHPTFRGLSFYTGHFFPTFSACFLLGVSSTSFPSMSNNSRVSMSFSSAWYKNRPTVLQGWLVKLRVSFAPFPVVLSSRNVCAHSASPSTTHSIADTPAVSRVDGIYGSCNFGDVRPLISSGR